MRKTKQAFTLIELLVVLAIIVILVSILLPVFFSAREDGRQAKCISNARQIGMALMQYRDDNDDCFMQQPDNDAGDPFGSDPNPADFKAWYDWIQPYLKSYQVLQCPSFKGKIPVADFDGLGRLYYSNYAISYHVLGPQIHGLDAKIPSPTQTLLVAEISSGLDIFGDFATSFTGPDLLLDGGGMHFVQSLPGTDDLGDPAIFAQVTGVGVDGHAKPMPMNDLNGGGITQTPDGRLHDPPGGWAGLYITGPDGELSITNQ